MFEKVKQILAEHLGIDEDMIHMDSELEADLGADSLDSIEILMDVEDEYGIEIPDEVLETMVTVGDIVNYLEDQDF